MPHSEGTLSMHWSIAAPFFEEETLSDAVWLDDFIDPKCHTFTKVPRRRQDSTRSWHHRTSRNTTVSGWSSIWSQASEAWRATPGGSSRSSPSWPSSWGSRSDFRGGRPRSSRGASTSATSTRGRRRALARLAALRIDHFVVHSRRECETVSRWLGLPRDRFRRPAPEGPHRDHRTRGPRPSVHPVDGLGQSRLRDLLRGGEEARPPDAGGGIEPLARRPGGPAQRRAAPAAIARRMPPPAQRARLNVVPLIDHHTAAGQVTIIERSDCRRPVITTRSPGSEDYVDHGKTGILVAPGAVDELAREIDHLWNDPDLRGSLSREAGRFAEEQLSDEVAVPTSRRSSTDSVRDDRSASQKSKHVGTDRPRIGYPRRPNRSPRRVHTFAARWPLPFEHHDPHHPHQPDRPRRPPRAGPDRHARPQLLHRQLPRTSRSPSGSLAAYPVVRGGDQGRPVVHGGQREGEGPGHRRVEPSPSRSPS